MKVAIPIHKVYKGWESLGKSSNYLWEAFTKRTFCHLKLWMDCKLWLRLRGSTLLNLQPELSEPPIVNTVSCGIVYILVFRTFSVSFCYILI